MPYKDPEKARIKLNERKRRIRTRKKITQFGYNPGDLRGKHGHHPRGNKCHLWNPGKLFTQDGYVLIRVGITHPLADPNGYAPEHLLVWVSAGNPVPFVNELLHHKDEDRTNNRIENLELKLRGSITPFTTPHVEGMKKDISFPKPLAVSLMARNGMSYRR